MAAEAVGLAASVAGLVSLGLQVTGDIVAYLDALKNREEELASTKRQSDALAAALAAIKAASSRFPNQPHDKAIAQSIQSCEAELRAVEELLADLASCDASTWRHRLKNKKRELGYRFDRSKIQQVAQRLHHANDILQLTLAGLELDVSASNRDSLTAINTRSREHAFSLLQVRDSNEAIQIGVGQAHDLMQLNFQRHLEKLETIEKLQQMTLFAMRGASKPSMLRETCDNVQSSTQELNSPLQESQRQVQRHGLGPLQNSRLAAITGRYCICPSPYRLTTKKGMRLGRLKLSKEQELRGHWPSCPMAKSTTETRKAISFDYTGTAYILQLAVAIPFAMTTGAGGFSISQSLTYRPVVDENYDPAFRILSTVWECCRLCRDEDVTPFLDECLRRLVKLFDERKANPGATIDKNKSLMHQTIWAYPNATAGKRTTSQRGLNKAFVDLIKTLLWYGVPAFSYDNQGLSPILNLNLSNGYRDKDIADALVQANSASNSVVIKGSRYKEYGIPAARYLPMYNASRGFAEACECGPLGMAVIRNNSSEVVRLVSRHPGSLAELDTFGQTPLHLAAAKPQILSIIVKAAGSKLLNQQDYSDATALEAAMTLSSTNCINGRSSRICQDCGCVICVDILLGAGSVVRNQKRRMGERSPGLNNMLRGASELARFRYVSHMRPVRKYLPHHRLMGRHAPKEPEYDGVDSFYSINNEHPFPVEQHKTGDVGWVYEEIGDPSLANLFYCHGFQPDRDIFTHLPNTSDWLWMTSDICSYFCWLVGHGADLFIRSSIRPPYIDDDSDTGIYGAHCALFTVGMAMPEFSSGTASFDTISVAVMQRDLSDGCECHCSRGGCDPFIWMMKGSLTGQHIQCVPGSLYCYRYRTMMEDYYSGCSPGMTELTYEAAIRYITFQGLGLAHTCCKTFLMWEHTADYCNTIDSWKHAMDEGIWMDRHEARMLNEEQSSLLGLHEELVSEFTTVAPRFLKDESGSYTSFSRFWSEYWYARIEEELERLDNDQLTDAERRGAESVGVQWCERPPVKAAVKNPYGYRTPEHYFFELDQICPEYREYDFQD